jgi:hypothetical protein
MIRRMSIALAIAAGLLVTVAPTGSGAVRFGQGGWPVTLVRGVPVACGNDAGGCHSATTADGSLVPSFARPAYFRSAGWRAR